jgi:hypothetical protein
VEEVVVQHIGWFFRDQACDRLKGTGKKVFRPVGTPKEKKSKAIKLHAYKKLQVWQRAQKLRSL